MRTPCVSCGSETADGCGTKITKLTKITKTKSFFFVIFVAFVVFVGATVVRLDQAFRLVKKC